MTTRWQEPGGYSDISVAIDEIYALRALLANEADILRAHLDFKTFPKSRRAFAEQQIERMILAASGDYQRAQAHKDYDGKRALSRMGIDNILTNGQWAEQRGLERVTE